MSNGAILIIVIAFIVCAFLLYRYISKKREEKELNATHSDVHVANQTEVEEEDDEDDEDGRFSLFEGEEIGWSEEFSLCIDNSTGVQYLIIYGIGMTLLLDENGKPIMHLSGKALENLKKKTSNFNIQVSVSDEKKYAIAYVIIESV